jgi:DNA-binding response OmpR family regulator
MGMTKTPLVNQTQIFTPVVLDRPAPFVAGPLSVDLASQTVQVNGKPLNLKPLLFRVLATFIANVNVLLTREQLLELAWYNPEEVDSMRCVDVAVRRLRIELGAAAPLLRTRHKVGYILVTPISVSTSPGSAVR